jgi:hypothetical protein
VTENKLGGPIDEIVFGPPAHEETFHDHAHSSGQVPEPGVFHWHAHYHSGGVAGGNTHIHRHLHPAPGETGAS